ncbi:MAG: hypothetical protein E7E64_04950 [Clostridium celatum]|uniref:hypothetical protein n=1 Tax=Clostridium tertium TaxID=1559 RepID=UPI0029019BF1|nr:hypothetical protein [Clostridium celatum]
MNNKNETFGSGMSYFNFATAIRNGLQEIITNPDSQKSTNQKTIILDPEYEYSELANTLGEAIISLDSSKVTSFNPFEIFSESKEVSWTNDLIIEGIELVKELNDELTTADILEKICILNNINLSSENKDYILNCFEN